MLWLKWSPASYQKGPGLYSGQPTWHLWWMKWHWNRFSIRAMVLLCQYHSTSAPHFDLIPSPSTLYNLSNFIKPAVPCTATAFVTCECVWSRKGIEVIRDPKFSCRYGKGLCSPAHCGYHLIFELCVFLLYFLATEMHPHQLCYIKTYETLKKLKMKMDVMCVADNLVKLGVLPCSCT